MEITYLGHSCFFIKSIGGLRVVTDPYSKIIKYALPDIEADIIVQSHEHYDHNGSNRIGGSPQIIKGAASHSVEHELNIPGSTEPLVFKGIICCHDDSSGKKHGTNTIFLWTLDDMNFCFLGDLGHAPSDNLLKQIGKVDVLFIPVGGASTINSTEASILINRINPLAVFPMHYNTPAIAHLKLAEEPLEEFLSKVNSKEILEGNTIAFDAITLPVATKIFALKGPEGT